MFNSYNQNPYFNPYFNTQPQQVPPTPMRYNTGLQGKSIDNLEVVKAMDIPLDGSINYFPIADGSAIVTKRLQMDGTSKITIYKATEDDITETFPSMNNEELTKIFDEIRNDIKELKQTLNKEDDKNE